MMLSLKLKYSGGSVHFLEAPSTTEDFRNVISAETVFDGSDFYFLQNGRKIEDNKPVSSGEVLAIPRLVGGKGGFGSMLRAIGAQIEKTTNREACRDLSGRRLRDINEEKRLKNWITQQAEREQEAEERRQKKLERLCQEPKHEFKDKKYEEERSVLTEKVCDAVAQGFKAYVGKSSDESLKRKNVEKTSAAKKKKKSCLWIDADEDEISSSLDSDDSCEEDSHKVKQNSRVDSKPVSSCDSEDSTSALPGTSDIAASSSRSLALCQ